MRSFVLLALCGLSLGQVIPEPRADADGCDFKFAFTNTSQQAYLQSPNYPNQYPNNANIKYCVSTLPGTQISLDCKEFNVEYSSNCVYDGVSVSLSGNNDLKDAMTACGEGTFVRQTTGSALTVGFKSDGSNPASSSVFRFRCVMSVVGTPTAASTAAPATTKAPTAAPAATTKAPATTTKAPAAASGAFANTTCSCGTRNDGTRIVGGTEAGTNEFPWRVALYSPQMGVFCGGTIISQNWVLTAAHCTNALPKGAELYADVADHDLSTTAESSNQMVKCDRIVQHASYNNETQDNDMSLCHLATPLTYSRTIQPACLPWNMAGQTFQGKTVTASGWGTTSSGGSAAGKLRKVDLPVKTTAECRQYYQNAITDNMLCTYSPGKDTCQGDSGGSIDYNDPATGRYYAIGVVSWGVGCAGVNQPGVYAKVTNYLSWLQTQTGDKFCK